MPDFDTLLAHEPGWAWLKDRGWTIVPTVFKVGTARANAPEKRIEMKPSEFANPSKRTLRYVLPHEIGHGVHFEIAGWTAPELRAARNLDWAGTVEVVAERWCIERDKGAWMKATVRASCIWHGKVKRGRYTFADVMCTEAGALVAKLQGEVAGV